MATRCCAARLLGVVSDNRFASVHTKDYISKYYCAHYNAHGACRTGMGAASELNRASRITYAQNKRTFVPLVVFLVESEPCYMKTDGRTTKSHTHTHIFEAKLAISVWAESVEGRVVVVPVVDGSGSYWVDLIARVEQRKRNRFVALYRKHDVVQRKTADEPFCNLPTTQAKTYKESFSFSPSILQTLCRCQIK